MVSPEESFETQCFDFLNNFSRIIRNGDSRAGMDFPPQAAHLSRSMIYLGPSVKMQGTGRSIHSALLGKLTLEATGLPRCISRKSG